MQLNLELDAEQTRRLVALQARFATACNALVPIVRESRCWHRVTLHHIAYRTLRDAFPDLGAQMACNAIYSVSRACRHIFQSQESPFYRAKRVDTPLPVMEFLSASPVFFDRHTISIKNATLSMFTLEGRMRFLVRLSAEDEARFQNEKLREVVLVRRDMRFQLNFFFSPSDAEDGLEESQFSVVFPDTPVSSSSNPSDLVVKISSQLSESLTS